MFPAAVFTYSPTSESKMSRIFVFITFLLVSCSAYPFRQANQKLKFQGRQFDQRDDQFEQNVETFVGKVFRTASDVIFYIPKFVLPKIFTSAPLLSVESRSLKTNGRHNISTSLKASSPMRPRKSSIVCPELPLPVIPNFSTVLAPYGTTGHQILGILPKSESSNSNWWVGDIQIPENVHLIMTPPQPATMPYNFEVLVLVEKRKIAPPKSRILNYSFPPLRYLTTDGGGFFSPTNSQLVAMPFFDFQSFNIQLKNSPYLALSLLPNSHPLSNALSTNPSVPIPIIPKPIPILQPIPPNQLSQPVTPSPPLLPPSDDVSALVHSLGDFTAKYPGTPLFQLPDNFEITGVHPDHIRTFLGKAYPLILVPKSFPPSQDHLPLMGPPNHDESHQLWTDFQLVAKMDADPWTPPFFHPFVLVSARLLINLSENEVPLPIFINTTEVDGVTGNEILQVIMIRDPRQPPAHSYHVMCIVPKISRNTNSMTDVPESPAIYPSRIIPDNTTTTLPTNTETSTIAVTESGIRGNQHDSESEKKPKPLPSKKSWKNRLASYGVVEPSVKVIKREPTATGHSILISLFGL